MLFRFDIDPFSLSTNRKWLVGTPRPVKTDVYRAAQREIELVTRDTMNRRRWKTLLGPVRVLLVCSWKDERGGDYGCNEKGVIDAIAKGGAIGNDKQVRVCTLIRHVGAAPGIVVSIAEERRSSLDVMTDALAAFGGPD